MVEMVRSAWAATRGPKAGGFRGSSVSAGSCSPMARSKARGRGAAGGTMGQGRVCPGMMELWLPAGGDGSHRQKRTEMLVSSP
jgi:hypothetical protein